MTEPSSKTFDPAPGGVLISLYNKIITMQLEVIIIHSADRAQHALVSGGTNFAGRWMII
jgi:hypothetical protein